MPDRKKKQDEQERQQQDETKRAKPLKDLPEERVEEPRSDQVKGGRPKNIRQNDA